MKGEDVSGLPLLEQKTRWLDQLEQTFELEATLDDNRYVYRVVFEPGQDGPRVKSECVHIDGKPIFEFVAGGVQLYDDSVFAPLGKLFSLGWRERIKVLQGSLNIFLRLRFQRDVVAHRKDITGNS